MFGIVDIFHFFNANLTFAVV